MRIENQILLDGGSVNVPKVTTLGLIVGDWRWHWQERIPFQFGASSIMYRSKNAAIERALVNAA